MPRERQVLVGLGAVAVAGLLFDKIVLGPGAAEAAPAPVSEAALEPAKASAASAVARLKSGVRGAMEHALREHISEQMPELAFGADPSWTVRPAALLTLPETPAEPGTPVAAPPRGVGPTLTLVMPTRDGGVAVIDGHRLAVGESHPAGFRLLAVQDRSATVLVDGRTVTLRLPSPGN